MNSQVPTPDFIRTLQQSLQDELPGQEAQYRMSHVLRKTYRKAEKDARIACVMCLFYQKDGVWHLPLIKRTSKNPNDRHGGQMGLPGGKTEDQDEHLIATALRETEEEIGISTHLIQVVGALTPLYIPVSNFNVYPFVGYLPEMPRFIRQMEEVDEVVEVALEELLNANNRRLTDMRVRENVVLREVPYFSVANRIVWGATAMMLGELIEVIQGSPILDIEPSL